MTTAVLLVLSLFVGLAYQATLPANVVEVYFVVDQQVVNRYIAERTESSASARETKAREALVADVDYIITEMNEFYASLEARGLNIRLAKRKLDILDGNIFGDNTDVSPGLKTFDAWLLQEGKYAALNYDAAILWTGFELVDNGDKGVAGYAHVGQVCKNVNSTGIAEYDLTYHLAVTTAHELGHILGASHDSAATGYVMIPTSSSKEENRWKFSLCTKEAFSAVIGKLDTNCMATASPASVTPSADVTDALANPDTVCRRAVNNQNSYMCRSSNFYNDAAPKGDAVCKQIWCNAVTSSYCNDAFASDGMICETNKRCNDGLCVDHPDTESANADNNCLWGDQAIVKYNTNRGPYEGDCAGFIDLVGKSTCDQGSVASSCCGTCESIKTGIPGCMYGDTFGSCNQYTQAQICDNYADICCEFCQGYRKKRGADGDTSGGVKLDRNAGQVKVTEDLKPKPEKKADDSPPPESMA